MFPPLHQRNGRGFDSIYDNVTKIFFQVRKVNTCLNSDESRIEGLFSKRRFLEIVGWLEIREAKKKEGDPARIKRETPKSEGFI